MTYTEYLKSLGACQNAIMAAEGKTAQEVWEICERGEWMLWLAGKLAGVPGCDRRRKLVFATVECARLVWLYVREQDKCTVQTCYETAERWARGENGVTLENVRIAADAAAYAAAYAADAAACAAARTAAYAADAAACAAARTAACTAADITLKQCADIVRKHYPISPAVEIIGPDK